MRRYELVIHIDDERLGWKVEPNRYLPRAYTITVRKSFWASNVDGTYLGDVTPEEEAAFQRGEITSDDTDRNRLMGLYDWLKLHIETTEHQPPRCVTLHASRGIGTPEQRAPLAGIITEASAHIASTTGGYADLPDAIQYEDVKWELGRVRGRKRARQPITPERLTDVARVARENPRKPTAAVERRFGISHGYARKLIKLAQTAADAT